MATLFDLPPEWEEWLATRPPAVQEVCRKWPPNKLYRYGPHRVVIYSVDEKNDGTVTECTVAVTGKFNRVAFERNVFGVKLADLVECDLPDPDEKLGSLDMDPLEALRRGVKDQA